jgi:hypothetical protein
VCESVADRADLYLGLLAEVDASSELGRAARQPGRGLCWPHLARGLERVRGTDARGRLLDIYTRADDELSAELDEYLRLFDARFTAEERGAEQTSWRRALLRAVGLPHHRVAKDG